MSSGKVLMSSGCKVTALVRRILDEQNGGRLLKLDLHPVDANVDVPKSSRNGRPRSAVRA